VTDGIPRSIDAGPLAVPHAEDAVVETIVESDGELAPHHRCRCEFLVDRRPIDDRKIRSGGTRPLDLVAERGDRRTLIATDECSCVQPVAAVDAELVDRQAGDGLQTRQEHSALFAPIPVDDLVVGDCRTCSIGHGASLPHLEAAVIRVPTAIDETCPRSPTAVS
jgi:hypothetical protein